MPPAVRGERVRMLGQLLLASGEEAVRALGQPGMIGRHVIGYVVEDQSQSAVRQLLAGGRETGRAAEPLVHDVIAHAVRRADHVLGTEVGQRGPVPGVDFRIRQRDPEAGWTALPDTHQPHGIDRGSCDTVPDLVWHLAELERATVRAAEPLQPDRGIDLVDRRAGREAHVGRSVGDARGLCAQCAGERGRSATVPVQPVW